MVYGLGLWAAKCAGVLGADRSASTFWSAPANVERLGQRILTDVTWLTNLGIMGGAFFVGAWLHDFIRPILDLPLRDWVATIVAGILLGYSSHLEFGCNLGAFFSGVGS